MDKIEDGEVARACSMHESEALVGRPRCRLEATVKKVRNKQSLENAGYFFGWYRLNSCGLIWEFPLHCETQTGSGPTQSILWAVWLEHEADHWPESRQGALPPWPCIHLYYRVCLMCYCSIVMSVCWILKREVVSCCEILKMSDIVFCLFTGSERITDTLDQMWRGSKEFREAK